MHSVLYIVEQSCTEVAISCGMRTGFSGGVSFYNGKTDQVNVRMNFMCNTCAIKCV